MRAATIGSRRSGLTVSLVAVAAILLLTMLPGTPVPEGRTDCCLTNDSLLNILLFLPLGIGLALTGASVGVAALAGGLGSGAIELAQRFLIPGRDASVRDVVCNTLGCLVGALIVHHWTRRQAWWRLAGGGLSVLVVLYMFLGPRLVVPGYPLHRPWYSMWTQETPGRVRFPGQVLSFSLMGQELPGGPIPTWETLGETVRRTDTVRFELVMETGGPIPGTAQIAGIVMGSPGPMYLDILGRERDLLVYPRLAMSSLELRSPTLRIDDVFPDTAGDTLRVQVMLDRRAVQVRVSGKRIEEASLPLASDLAWVAVSPLDLLAPESSSSWWIRGLAVLGGLGLLGFGAGRRVWLIVIGVLAWLLAGPLLYHVSAMHPIVVGFGLTGLVLGSRLARVLRLA